MLRKMLYVPRHHQESAESHMTRLVRLLRNCRAQHKFLHGDETYCASWFSWCGHIARITTRVPTRETSKLFSHKKYGLASEHEEGTGHTMSRTSPQSLEMGAGSGPMPGDECVNTAQNSTAWRSKLEEMINWKNEKWSIARVLK